jgi:hypothetical protein
VVTPLALTLTRFDTVDGTGVAEAAAGRRARIAQAIGKPLR